VSEHRELKESGCVAGGLRNQLGGAGKRFSPRSIMRLVERSRRDMLDVSASPGQITCSILIRRFTRSGLVDELGNRSVIVGRSIRHRSAFLSPPRTIRLRDGVSVRSLQIESSAGRGGAGRGFVRSCGGA